MPEGFTVVGQKMSFLIPYGWVMERLRAAQGRGTSYGIARLRDGVTLEQAGGEMRNLMSERRRRRPVSIPGGPRCSCPSTNRWSSRFDRRSSF